MPLTEFEIVAVHENRNRMMVRYVDDEGNEIVTGIPYPPTMRNIGEIQDWCKHMYPGQEESRAARRASQAAKNRLMAQVGRVVSVIS